MGTLTREYFRRYLPVMPAPIYAGAIEIVTTNACKLWAAMGAEAPETHPALSAAGHARLLMVIGSERV
jgi:hypothetical protein